MSVIPKSLSRFRRRPPVRQLLWSLPQVCGLYGTARFEAQAKIVLAAAMMEAIGKNLLNAKEAWQRGADATAWGKHVPP
ncbi:hypothetical protein [Neotabrizicola sp. sgz301269]|uniref:hypothetical protein n=1 Tax=Neotabrizicola sp. sgz301269 TaxID=3276282 RepID=UPI003770553A